MKYIKTYEDTTESLKVGDHVKFIKNSTPEEIENLPIYKIIEVDAWSPNYKYKIENKECKTYKIIWAKRDELLLIPEYVIAAKKYNI